MSDSRDPWHGAACRSVPYDTHYPTAEPDSPAHTRQVARAKRVCAGCPVLDACREHALTVGEKWGVWGGLDEQERRAIRRRNRCTDLPIAS
ncbi:Sporulation regulatory protein WhiD [Pseudonocardia sp. Ae406_Ps2]|uniref:WhiB family transcriptional regulator n=1 Tax=unclassified Pseudonocardia TaxID=2619320 RepID=UPI00094AE003|nr:MULTISPECIES: WhiB family transcriptional regulator [unclassified Pseudonocardia]OLL89460.1 Sporulation regulatory protein WhiD [Pseudonocardia sp. Ae331_Ps2]OLL89917.1 Sporulation regulatory protein WhiD [Pseudonocardia sp. Ae406_Ps2]